MAERQPQEAAEDDDGGNVSGDQVDHRASSGSRCELPATRAPAGEGASSISNSIRYRMATRTAARNSVQAIVTRKAKSIWGNRALLTITGPGCWVRHPVTLK